MVIFVLVGVLQHPAQELMFIFRGNFRTFRCSAPSQELMFIFRGNFPTFRCSAPSGPRTDVLCRGGAVESTSGPSKIVVMWWCGDVFVVVFLWWCGDVFAQ